MASASVTIPACAQLEHSVYGDVVMADVKMKYVYSMEEAFSLSRQTKKPIFINFFADWAIPCHGMNKEVFSDADFCDYMDKHFVCLWLNMDMKENESVAEQYGVKSYAHYLVIDADGNILLRLVGVTVCPISRSRWQGASVPRHRWRARQRYIRAANTPRKTCPTISKPCAWQSRRMTSRRWERNI